MTDQDQLEHIAETAERDLLQADVDKMSRADYHDMVGKMSDIVSNELERAARKARFTPRTMPFRRVSWPDAD